MDALLHEVARDLEDLRESLGLEGGQELDLLVETPSFSTHRLLEERREDLRRAAGAHLQGVKSWIEEPPEGAVCRRVQDLDLHVLLPEGFDREAAADRLRRRLEGETDPLRRARLRDLLGML